VVPDFGGGLGTSRLRPRFRKNFRARCPRRTVVRDIDDNLGGRKGPCRDFAVIVLTPVRERLENYFVAFSRELAATLVPMSRPASPLQ